MSTTLVCLFLKEINLLNFLLSSAKIVDANIARIAGSLPNWQLVARKLGFGEEDIKDIETNHQRCEDRRIAFMRKWIMKNGTKATYEKLSKALEELDQQGAADKIIEIASEQ